VHVAAVGVFAVDCGVQEEEEAEGELVGRGGLLVCMVGRGREMGRVGEGGYEGSGGVYACGTKGG